MNTAFDEVRLPEDIETGAAVGPSFKTTIVPLSNGAEQRNADWQQEKFVADISYGIMAKQNPRDQADSFAAVMRFYRARMGRWRGFRFRDWSDFEAVEEPLKMITPLYARLQVTYDEYYIRNITRPVVGSIVIPGAPAFSVLPGGVIMFNSPQSADTVASFQFDVPCRFETDMAQVTLEHINAGTIGGIKLMQVPDPVTSDVFEIIADA